MTQRISKQAKAYRVFACLEAGYVSVTTRLPKSSKIRRMGGHGAGSGRADALSVGSATPVPLLPTPNSLLPTPDSQNTSEAFTPSDPP